VVSVREVLFATDPWRFQELLERAASIDSRAEHAAALATADAAGRPSVRMVLLAAHDHRGFVFHTSYASRKGRELAEIPGPRSASIGPRSSPSSGASTRPA
jgi:pyridoxine/pyridoxamine 5'-phosphate oxidase